MSLDCIVFSKGEEPRLIKVRELNQDVSFIVNGQWQNRRVKEFSIKENGKIVTYLCAYDIDDKPDDSVIKQAIVSKKPQPCEGLE
ncbi:hypothetical protein AAS80_003018 [Escherichia coli]|uniref:hypothetical protein n=1 Tax=Escherichia coli TaxID=562 RepID=UPI000E04040D|nr:hypothetical protein [Escherichia coli]EFL6449046.1 hypothetical protein [Escherichia coli]STK94630.1 Uncharacterised protein [Escherichia coli]